MSEQSLIEKEVQAQLSRALVDAEILRKQLLDARLEIRLLRSKLDALARRTFGKKSVTVRATPSSARFGWRGEYVHANSGPSVQTILTSDRCNS